MRRLCPLICFAIIVLAASCSSGGGRSCLAEHSAGTRSVCLLQSAGLTEKTRHSIVIRESGVVKRTVDLASIDRRFQYGSSSGTEFAEIVMDPGDMAVSLAIKLGGEPTFVVCGIRSESNDRDQDCLLLKAKIKTKYGLPEGVDVLTWVRSYEAQQRYSEWYFKTSQHE